MFEAKNIMAKEVFTVSPDSPIYDALKILIDHGVSGLPVVDGDNNIRGIISEKDMLKLLVNKDVSDNQTVADYMSSEVKGFGPEDSAVDICEFFINNPFRRVPIIENGKLAGVVSRRDIISLILDIRNKSGNK